MWPYILSAKWIEHSSFSWKTVTMKKNSRKRDVFFYRVIYIPYLYRRIHMIFGQSLATIHSTICNGFFLCKKFIKRIWLFFGSFSREVHSAHSSFFAREFIEICSKCTNLPSSPLLTVISRQIFLHSNWTTVEPWQQQQQQNTIYKNKINPHKTKQIKKTV